VEATNELCLFEGPEGGIGTPLGKKLKTRPLYGNRGFCCFGRRSSEPSFSLMVAPVLVAVQEPTRSKKARRIAREKALHGRCKVLE